MVGCWSALCGFRRRPSFPDGDYYPPSRPISPTSYSGSSPISDTPSVIETIRKDTVTTRTRRGRKRTKQKTEETRQLTQVKSPASRQYYLPGSLRRRPRRVATVVETVTVSETTKPTRCESCGYYTWDRICGGWECQKCFWPVWDNL